MTFEQWCVMVYEMACDKYWKGNTNERFIGCCIMKMCLSSFGQ